MNFIIPEVVGVRKLVPLLNNNKVPQVFLNNAACTKPFKDVIKFIAEVAPYCHDTYRSEGLESIFCSDRYEEAKDIVGEFVGWDKEQDLVLPLHSTAEGFEILADSIQFQSGDRIITGISPHLSSDLSWRGKAKIDYLPICSSSEVLLAKLKWLLDAPGRVRVVSVSGACNLTGAIAPIHEIALIAHQYGALVVVDGTQLIAHRPFKMKPHDDYRHIDFVVFSGHQMNCPLRVGAIVGRQDILDAASPCQLRGEMVPKNTEQVIWAQAGKQQKAIMSNTLGFFALAKAIKTINTVGIAKISAHEQHLTALMLKGLSSIQGVKILNHDLNVENRVGVVTFAIPRLHHALVGAILSYEWGIAVHYGGFNTHPLIMQLLEISPEVEKYYRRETLEGRGGNAPGAIRVSLGIHNTEADIAKLVEAVNQIAQAKWEGNYEQKVNSSKFSPQNSQFDLQNLLRFAQRSNLSQLMIAKLLQPAVIASLLLLCFASLGALAWWSDRDLEPQPNKAVLTQDWLGSDRS